MKYLFLPSEVTAFEDQYVERMNRIGLGFFWANLPVFVVVAYFNETNAQLAVVLTLLTLAGPTLAWLTLSSRRAVSMVLGFTAMCMGGLLVHFGQGELQIEMHFYFFSLLAVLAMFANPAVIHVAAVTVTLHHTVLWLFLPTSLFNHEATIWVVAVHALFVVVESAAATFIAQSFFDNVIGLDRIVQERTAALDQRNGDMREVLDHVREGLLTVDLSGEMSSERSAVFDDWFGVPALADRYADHMMAHDPAFASWFELAWEGLQDGFLPPEVAFSQLPTRLSANERQYEVEYSPVQGSDGELEAGLVVVTDITERLALEAAESAQREHLRLVECFVMDRAGVSEFFEEASELLAMLKGPAQQSAALCKRFLHTFKGNAMAYGFDDLGELAHQLEGSLIDEDRPPTLHELEELSSRFETLSEALASLRQERDGATVEVPRDELERASEMLQTPSNTGAVQDLMIAWSLESAEVRLDRIRRQAEGIAERLGKGDVRIVADANGVRLDASRFRSFWQAFLHVVRNAVDHGIEPPDQRDASGKGAATVVIRTRIHQGALLVELSDDGRGIDWPAVAQKARSLGLPAESQEDLVEALFSDGVSTACEVTAFSGRGVGMGAVRASTEALGGTVSVHSAQNVGSTVRFHFPAPPDDAFVWSDALAS